ncbi:MAG: GNAT family N-acetyltransferase [Bacteroidia bacterium]|nr:GNAT family N-acetyltransferase [Bacteroidia bacterium]
MIEQFAFSRLKPTTAIKPFDCDNQDLNDFLLQDAVNHMKELLAITYLWEDESETVAYFSVLNDSIRHGDTTISKLRKILKIMPFKKRGYPSHPAVKVGRLAVNKKHQSQGIGSELMDYIKGYFLDNNKTGCRFITVDADNNPRTTNFYKTNGFDYLTSTDEKKKNRLMYFDLILYAPYVVHR